MARRISSEGSFRVIGGMRVWEGPAIERYERRLELERAAVARGDWNWRQSWEDVGD